MITSFLFYLPLVLLLTNYLLDLYFIIKRSRRKLTTKQKWIISLVVFYMLFLIGPGVNYQYWLFQKWTFHFIPQIVASLAIPLGYFLLKSKIKDMAKFSYKDTDYRLGDRLLALMVYPWGGFLVYYVSYIVITILLRVTK